MKSYKKVVETDLRNGVTICVPDVEVEIYDGEECYAASEWRKVENAITHLFPDYFVPVKRKRKT